MTQEIRLIRIALKYVQDMAEIDEELMNMLKEATDMDSESIDTMLTDLLEANDYRITIVKIK